MVELSIATDSLSDAFTFVKANFKNLGKAYLSISAASFALVLLALVASGLVIYGFSLLGSIGTIAGAVIAVVILVVGIFIAGAVDYAAYNYTQAIYRRKDADIVEIAKHNAVPLLKFIIIMFFIQLLIALPFLVGMLFTATIPLVPDLIQMVMSVVTAFVSMFFIFTLYMMFLDDRGARESFKESFRLVRSHFWETVVFSLLLYAISLVVSIPFIILVFLGVALGVGAVLVNVWLLVPVGLLAIVLILLFSALTYMVELPATYLYWCRVSGRKP